MEQTIVIIKPGFYWLEVVVRSMAFILSARIKARVKTWIGPETIRAFYGDEKADTYPEMTKYLTSGECIFLVIDGQNVVNKFQRLKLIIRRILRRKPPADGIHAADSLEEAAKQIKIVQNLG